MSVTGSLDYLRQKYSPQPVKSEYDQSANKFRRSVEQAVVGKRGLVIAGVTSRTQGAFQSDETPYGAGKTTLALRLARKYNHFDPELKRYDIYGIQGLDSTDENGYEETNAGTFDDPEKMLHYLQTALTTKKRFGAVVWDDVQVKAPSETGKSRKLANIVGEIQRQRFTVGLLLLTFPGIKDIASSVAGLLQYEFIIYRTGKFELQMYHRRKDWKHPRNDWERMEFQSGDPTSGVEFGPLPPKEQRWYDNWRTQRMLMGRAPEPAPQDVLPQKTGWGET